MTFQVIKEVKKWHSSIFKGRNEWLQRSVTYFSTFSVSESSMCWFYQLLLYLCSLKWVTDLCDHSSLHFIMEENHSLTFLITWKVKRQEFFWNLWAVSSLITSQKNCLFFFFHFEKFQTCKMKSKWSIFDSEVRLAPNLNPSN